MKPHILFVDDDGDIRELAQAVLETAGFRVTTADSSTEALELAMSERFDAFLLDYWMSDATGIQLCDQIRGFDKTTPILICSGAVTEADKHAAFLAGAQGYVDKPFSARELTRALRSLLESKISN